MLALEIHLLLKLSTHLGLLNHDLLLDVLIGLDFELGVDLLCDPFSFFIKAQCLVVLQLLQFYMLF